MNSAFQRQQYNGFRLDDTLMSRLNFSGIFHVSDVSRRWLDRGEDEPQPYWTLKDIYGAKISCFSPKLVEGIHTGEKYEVKGEIKIGKGGTYLNLKEAAPFNGADFTLK